MIDGFMIVSKEKAKQMIDDAPGDMVIITSMDVKSLTHYNNEKKSKERSKKLIDIAKEVGYQNNNIFGIICLEKEKTIDQHKIQNILFSQFEYKKMENFTCGK